MYIPVNQQLSLRQSIYNCYKYIVLQFLNLFSIRYQFQANLHNSLRSHILYNSFAIYLSILLYVYMYIYIFLTETPFVSFQFHVLFISFSTLYFWLSFSLDLIHYFHRLLYLYNWSSQDKCFCTFYFSFLIFYIR